MSPNTAARSAPRDSQCRARPSRSFPPQATPSRLVYRTPLLAGNRHIVCDIHSHGHGRAFFSATDDADDAHATKITLVIGRLGGPDSPEFASRLCAGGMLLPLPRSPFEGDGHDA